jgi:hypothetical protein
MAAFFTVSAMAVLVMKLPLLFAAVIVPFAAMEAAETTPLELQQTIPLPGVTVSSITWQLRLISNESSSLPK